MFHLEDWEKQINYFIEHLRLVMSEKSSSNSRFIQVHQKIVNERPVWSKKLHLPFAKQANQSWKNSFHIKINLPSKSKQNLKLIKHQISEAKLRNLQQQKHFSLFKNKSHWKGRQSELNLISKFSVLKNEANRRDFLTYSNDNHRSTRLPITLPGNPNRYPSPHQKYLKVMQKINQNSKDTIKRQTLFTMNRKQLRKHRKRQKKSNDLNCRVVNLFESLKQRIKTIHQDLTTANGLNLKDYLNKITKSCDQFEANRNGNLTIHTQTPCSQISMINKDNHIKSNEESPEKVIPFQLSQKRNFAQTYTISYQEQQFDIKPWSNQNIAIDF